MRSPPQLVGRAIRAQENGQAVEICRPHPRLRRAVPATRDGVMLVSDLHRAIGESLFQVPEFATWANAVADVMLYE